MIYFEKIKYNVITVYGNDEDGFWAKGYEMLD